MPDVTITPGGDLFKVFDEKLGKKVKVNVCDDGMDVDWPDLFKNTSVQ
jgi:hypothetical protein